MAAGISQKNGDPATATAGWQWHLVTTTTTALLSDITCPSKRTCLAVGEDPDSYTTFVASTDGGATWHTTYPALVGSQQWKNISCPSSSIFLATNIAGEEVVTSPDCGVTWRWHGMHFYPFVLRKATCPTARTCLAVGDGIAVSADGGISWTERNLKPGPNLHGQMPAPSLNAITCSTRRTCLAVGEYKYFKPRSLEVSSVVGVVLATTDGGTTWDRRYTGTDLALQGITCHVGRACLAVGDRWLYKHGQTESYGTAAAILASSDTGATWHSRRAPAGFSLRAVTCPTKRACLAVGAGLASIILSSADGGNSWRSDPTPTSVMLEGIACPGSAICLAVGVNGIILSSARGTTSASGYPSPSPSPAPGVAWYLVPSISVVGSSIACPTSSTCIVVGENQRGTMIVTSGDGGATWLLQNQTGDDEEMRGIICPSSDTCLATGLYGDVLISHDAGLTWQRHMVGAGIGTLYSVACATSSTCVAVGSSYNSSLNGAIAVSTDGGVTWHSRYIATKAGLPTGLFTVTCPTSTSCLAAGIESTILTSADGGMNWTQRDTFGTDSPFDLLSIACPTPTSCLAVGEEGTILVSADGGATWHRSSYHPNPIGSNLPSLDAITCPTHTTCVVVGGIPNAGATILISKDAGASWRSIDSGIADALPAVACLTRQICVSISAHGALLVGRVG
jgi:photosystem II stability/assembly factor-like uncharacterized protein